MESPTFSLTINYSNLKCFLTGIFMQDPVIIASGNVYEREAITNWFKTNNTDPITKDVLTDFYMIPSKLHLRIIDGYFMKHPEKIEERYVQIT